MSVDVSGWCRLHEQRRLTGFWEDMARREQEGQSAVWWARATASRQGEWTTGTETAADGESEKEKARTAVRM